MAEDIKADIVIIGGGIIGCAIADRLSQQTIGNIVLIERRQVAQESTSQAAGLMAVVRSKPATVSLVLETYRAITELQNYLGDSLGLQKVGSLYVVEQEESLAPLKQLISVAENFEQTFSWLTIAECQKIAPWISSEHIKHALFFPNEAYIDPYRLAMAYAQRAKSSQKVVFLEGETVLSIKHDKGQIQAVQTSERTVHSPIVIDCAGVWAIQLALELGYGLPFAPVRSHYWITEPIATVNEQQAMVLLPEAAAYLRPEVGALLFGLRDRESLTFSPKDLEGDLPQRAKNSEAMGWTSLLEGIDKLAEFIPALKEIGIAHYIAGLSGYSPDSVPIIGMLEGIQGAYVCTGMSGSGIAYSAGAARLITEIILEQKPFVDPAPFAYERFGEINPTDASFLKRCSDARSKKVSG